MDAGLAAVLGALAGATATIGAALATGWAQRESACIAARSEHRRQRREPRQKAYKEFIAAASELRVLTGTVRRAPKGAPLSVFTEDFLKSCIKVHAQISAQWLEIALAGPGEVEKAASRLESYSIDVITFVGWIVGVRKREVECTEESSSVLAKEAKETFGQFKDLVPKIYEALDEFVSAAQSALDDDGTSAEHLRPVK